MHRYAGREAPDEDPAWSLVAIGVLTMVYAGVEIVRIALDQRRRKAPGER
jgi:hypothetical protein